MPSSQPCNEFVSGDTGSKLRVTCRNDSPPNDPVDLTAAAVKLRWRNQANTATVEADMTGLNGAAFDASGIAEYTFTANQLYSPQMAFEIRITKGTLVVRSLELLVEDVRQAME